MENKIEIENTLQQISINDIIPVPSSSTVCVNYILRLLVAAKYTSTEQK